MKLDTGRKQFIALLLLCIVFVTLPFVLVRFIPSTDLPQHLAQIRLLQDILKNPNQSEYMVEWLGANTLVYYVIGFNWMIFEPILAGKMAVLEIGLAWVISIFALARHKQRSIFSAALACVFIFNASLYWSFLNYLLGWPVFTLWYLFVIDYQKSRSIVLEFIIILTASFFLFFTHVFWLLAGIVFLVIGNILRKQNLQRWLLHCFGLIPVGIYSAIWFPRFAAARASLDFNLTAYWHFSPLERLNPSWLLDAVLGGLRGPSEVLVIIGIILWIVLSLKTNWGQIQARTEKEFLLAGIFLVLIVLFAPEEYMNTIYFASRWAPVTMIFFLLALPLPRIPRPLIITHAIFFLAILSFATCYYWYRFEAAENSGLQESLNRITNNTMVIGLDFTHESKFLCGYPFLQTFAYAQVLYGGKLNFSFAEHHSGIVSFARADRIPQWTSGLEWYPERVNPSDFRQFDYALINGTENVHRLFTSLPELTQLTADGRWRVYQCERDTNTLH